MQKLYKKMEELERKLAEEKFCNQKLRLEFSDVLRSHLANKKPSSRVLDEDEFSFSKKLLLKHQKESDQMKEEIESLKDIKKKQRIKIRQLETELESVLKRLSIKDSPNPATNKKETLEENKKLRTHVSTEKSISPDPKRETNLSPYAYDATTPIIELLKKQNRSPDFKASNFKVGKINITDTIPASHTTNHINHRNTPHSRKKKDERKNTSNPPTTALDGSIDMKDISDRLNKLDELQTKIC